MNKQKERSLRILSSLKVSKLPFNIKDDNYSNLGKIISEFFYFVSNVRNGNASLKWCFANIKRTKIFLQIFTANEENRETYKEEIAKNISEYSYKTIAKIIDEGLARGYYVALEVDGNPSRDSKIKNIRPSEDLITSFLNLSIDIIHYIDSKKMRP